MNYDFVSSAWDGTAIRTNDLAYVEKKFNIHMPEKLKEYYLNYNDCSIAECNIYVAGKQYVITRIFPLIGDGLTFIEIKERFNEFETLEAYFYPIGRNDGEGLYLWHALTGEVWFMQENDGSPKQYLFSSVEQLFEAMNTAIRDGEYVREERGGEKQFLPLGSVVEVKDNAQKLIIVARGMNVEYGGEAFFFDYCGALYPDGVVSDQFIYFDDSNIGRIYFTGYHDDEDAVSIARLNAYIASHPELRRYVP